MHTHVHMHMLLHYLRWRLEVDDLGHADRVIEIRVERTKDSGNVHRLEPW